MSILSERLNIFANDVILKKGIQTGLKKGHSTADDICVLFHNNNDTDDNNNNNNKTMSYIYILHTAI